MAGAVSPEKQGRRPAVVKIGFGCFRNDIIFENGAAKGMNGDLSGLPDAQQAALARVVLPDCRGPVRVTTG